MYSKNLYYLTIREAAHLASLHDSEDGWDLWTDIEASELGRVHRICTALDHADMTALLSAL